MTAPDRPGLKQEHAPESWCRGGQSSGDRAPVEYGPLSCKLYGSASRLLTGPSFSIIAVQGLASTYERTWTKELQDGSRVMWLKDLLPKDLPSARILTFEYDSKWLNDPSHVSLRDCADRLIESIMWDRTHDGEATPCRHMVGPLGQWPSKTIISGLPSDTSVSGYRCGALLSCLGTALVGL